MWTKIRRQLPADFFFKSKKKEDSPENEGNINLLLWVCGK